VQGVKAASALLLLPSFDIINSFVPDYMHCALLGVCRQFLNIWTDSCNRSKPFFIRDCKVVDAILTAISPPDEVRRLPRTIADRTFWKASEYRNFLLLYSPVILWGILPKAYYYHWMLLVNGITMLLSEAVTVEMIVMSRACLRKFVVMTAELYGEEFVSYNVHILTHLPDAVTNWGPLWANSAFVFEDIIGFLKSFYFGTQLVPKQLFKSFCIWRNVQQLSSLLNDSNESAQSLFTKLTNSSHRIVNCVKVGSLVGLGVPNCRCLYVGEQISLHNSGYDILANVCTSTFDSYNRFIIHGKVFCTSQYAIRFKRDNSLIMFGSNRFGSIESCLVTRICSCSEGTCVCKRDCIIFVQEFKVVSQSHYDSFVNMNLMALVVRVVDNAELTPIAASQVAGKCVCIITGGNKYLIRLPLFEND